MKEIAAKGRYGDTELAHVARGEVIVPTDVNDDDLMDAIKKAFKKKKVPLERYIVGTKLNSRNPETGMTEYFPVAAALAAASLVSGAMSKGGDKIKSTPSSGYGTRPKEVQDFQLNEIFPDLQQYYNKPYEGALMKPASSDVYDPVFGSKAQQSYIDYLIGKNYRTPQAVQPSSDMTEKMAQSLRDEMIGRQLASSTPYASRGYGNRAKDLAMRIGNTGTPEDYAAIGKVSSGGRPDVSLENLSAFIKNALLGYGYGSSGSA